MGSHDHDRIWLDKQHPEIFHALNSVALTIRNAAATADLDRAVMELVNVRVSQLNTCAFCLDLHVRLAREAGVTAQQLAVLDAWRRSPELYTEQQQAALTLAEAVTTLPGETILEREYAAARQHLSDDQMSVLIWAATTIGAFNRVSILSKHPVRVRKEN
ncbi:carboxymuconolactone decarboxylase family protein [Nocardia huaxiensis]|uniref:Carboxymuconolactone decarboxylase family protein n=1 Tax=Nocardia huaxiensis TaxID=2755382 RepID=A0A7D6ZJ97_9NOCA|nr:carboxymuconolactone decarboxylase family protein [Nocardia huaxiensis]QLY32359.1 carboxymuconolactone decarboxylase family protein [Nocardia huaxiensis]UFS93932.1 carboxymuconolactone decarboxylase family protein [Nocardia huaxiensis]